jgi:hypothetical protein
MWSQYRWTSVGRNTVHVSAAAARVFVIESRLQKAHKKQND